MATKELEEYRLLAQPAELHKAINTLQGLICGVLADQVLNDKEAMELSNWCSLHANLKNRHPFNELLPVVENALADGVIDNEERKDILWLCERLDHKSMFFADYYDETSSAIQYLNGFAHGVLADGVLRDSEIAMLHSWLDKTSFLKGTYPFDELTSLLTVILSDGRIDEDERSMLMAFLGNLVDFKNSYNLSEVDFVNLREKYSVQGICACNPEIEFVGKTFVFTGESYKASRNDICEEIKRKNGIPLDSVSKKTDYLVVGEAGNPCWAYSCYGRKVEKAMQLRRAGAKVQIINETDFWNAIGKS